MDFLDDEFLFSFLRHIKQYSMTENCRCSLDKTKIPQNYEDFKEFIAKTFMLLPNSYKVTYPEKNHEGTNEDIIINSSESFELMKTHFKEGVIMITKDEIKSIIQKSPSKQYQKVKAGSNKKMEEEGGVIVKGQQSGYLEEQKLRVGFSPESQQQRQQFHLAKSRQLFQSTSNYLKEPIQNREQKVEKCPNCRREFLQSQPVCLYCKNQNLSQSPLIELKSEPSE